jgi:uncharacterized protein (TIGR03643 family)
MPPTKITQKYIESMDIGIRDQLIRAAWEDDVSFESIELQFGFSEPQTIAVMKNVMKPKMFNIWRQRVQGRGEKHSKKMTIEESSKNYYDTE